ncbi:MAG: hypothetical protein JF597_32615 [Streptomyces sp.]|uniref:hypothetical protein n=1 Tax=Streptomyces sp. TaxID=1931 RepID=UPI0025CFBF7C|nr:hypothetical protein [Streptomyces sp.]MBW8798163.1 hypothetical protein [Streptomyces sp.]
MRGRHGPAHAALRFGSAGTAAKSAFHFAKRASKNVHGTPAPFRYWIAVTPLRQPAHRPPRSPAFGGPSRPSDAAGIG